ncbi:MAG: TolC family protein [Elusimicrobia bacterium]|nr:TolC family protein [Elusimicrobiota bacterium]
MIAEVLLAAALAAAPRAQTSGSTAPVQTADLNQCYAWALEQAESLKIQEEQVRVIEQQFRQVLGSALPNLSFTALDKWIDTSGAAGQSSYLYQSPQPQVNFALSQTLFSGLREYAAMRSYKKQGKAAELQLRHAKTTLFQNVANAFYLTVNLEAQLANQKLAVDMHTARLKELRHFEDLGKSRHSEVTLEESQMATAETHVQTITGQVDAARAMLSFLTGQDMSSAALVDRLERVHEVGAEQPLLNHAYGRSDVVALQRLVESQEDQVTLAKGAFLPTVTALGDYYLKRQSALSPVHWDATLAASIPIYQGGGQVAAVRTAELQLSQARYNLELGVRQARSDIHTAYVALRAVVGAAAAAERAYKKADETYRAEIKEYRLGLVNNLDVLTAMNNLVGAKNAFDQITIQTKLDLLLLKLSDEELP